MGVNDHLISPDVLLKILTKHYPKHHLLENFCKRLCSIHGSGSFEHFRKKLNWPFEVKEMAKVS